MSGCDVEGLVGTVESEAGASASTSKEGDDGKRLPVPLSEKNRKTSKELRQEELARVNAYVLLSKPAAFTEYLRVQVKAVSGAFPYLFLEKIGYGSYGCVYKCCERMDASKVFAIKLIDHDQQLKRERTVRKEIKMLENLRGQAYIVHFVEALRSVTNRSISHMVFEYIDRMQPETLYAQLVLTDIRLYMWQLLRGLSACRANGIIHADIKPTNLLIEHSLKQKRLKIIDFGHARFYLPGERSTKAVTVGTLCYRAPEVLFNATHLHYAIDVWSAGVVFLNMLAPHRCPLWTASEDNFAHICKLNAKFGRTAVTKVCDKYEWKYYGLAAADGCSSWLDYFHKTSHALGQGLLGEKWLQREQDFFTADVQDLLDRLLCLDPQERITVDEALQHRFFDEA